MITFFSIPKPFHGHFAVIQRNAIRSWTLLRPSCDIILFGDDGGVAETSAALGLRHIPEVSRNEYGTPLLSDIFEKAQAVARHRILCHINADIILLGDFLKAIERIPWTRFLMIGQRWDLDVVDPVDFDDGEWEAKLAAEARARGSLHSYMGVDYYVFPSGLWGGIPHFAIGRTVYDNWLIWRARALGVPVVDATRVVMSIHQNHDRTYSSLGMQPPGAIDDLTRGVEARRNQELAGGRSRVLTLRDATWFLTTRGLIPAVTPWYVLGRLRTLARGVLLSVVRRSSVGPLSG